MASSRLLLSLLIISTLSLGISSKKSGHHLSLDYYAKTCPKFHDIVRETVFSKQSTNPTTAAAVLRMFMHDCMVDGCDASILIKSTAFNKAEIDADINHNLAGDGFDVITRVKTALELACPETVSCSDILAAATRDLVLMTGGPFYEVRLGRRDGKVSMAGHVEGNLAEEETSMGRAIAMFKKKGFTIRDMVALVGGGHTIGFAHCSEFGKRIFGKKVDPTINPALVAGLRRTCANYTENEALAAFLDVMSPGVFDNTIFRNIQKGLGVLGTDQALYSNNRTRGYVDLYAKDSKVFFNDFAKAMEKVSLFGVKYGHAGEIRKRCDVINGN